MAGELKIHGYSAYLHAIGDGLLLGVGQDATDTGRRLGSQVSLFGVSDPARPRRLATHALGNGQSPVEFDHHAFRWWKPRRLTVVPVQTWDPPGPFNGAVALERLLTLSDAGLLASGLGDRARTGWLRFS